MNENAVTRLMRTRFEDYNPTFTVYVDNDGNEHSTDVARSPSGDWTARLHRRTIVPSPYPARLMYQKHNEPPWEIATNARYTARSKWDAYKRVGYLSNTILWSDLVLQHL